MRFDDEPNATNLPSLSVHAEERIRQRGYRERDLETVMTYGTPCAEAIVLTDKAVRRAIEAKKREIQTLERLRGTAVIVEEDLIKTVYRPDRHRMRKLLSRRASRSGEAR